LRSFFRSAAIAALVFSLSIATTCGVRADDGSVGPVKYANGDVAKATEKCGPGDTCATITLANGDELRVLTGGSGACNPYVMTFMRYRAKALEAVWSTPTDRFPDAQGAFGGTRCGAFRNTHMMIDGGVIDMGIFNNKDGTVFIKFFGGTPAS
jgi:hypothetical protein